MEALWLCCRGEFDEASESLCLKQQQAPSPTPSLEGPTWVAVKELNVSYYIGETLLFTISTYYGNLT